MYLLKKTPSLDNGTPNNNARQRQGETNE